MGIGYCNLFGHEWQIIAGAGQHAGKRFMVCNNCTKVIPVDDASDRTGQGIDESMRDEPRQQIDRGS